MFYKTQTTGYTTSQNESESCHLSEATLDGFGGFLTCTRYMSKFSHIANKFEETCLLFEFLVYKNCNLLSMYLVFQKGIENSAEFDNRFPIIQYGLFLDSEQVKQGVFKDLIVIFRVTAVDICYDTLWLTKWYNKKKNFLYLQSCVISLKKLLVQSNARHRTSVFHAVESIALKIVELS